MDTSEHTPETPVTGALLIERGWAAGPAIGLALHAVAQLAAQGAEKGAILSTLDAVHDAPEWYATDPVLGALARHLTRPTVPESQIVQVREAPLDVPIWGRGMIDDAAVEQIRDAMRLPVTVAGALMPDAHVGYGIPIGGVVALEGAVAPYMVGVDIACRMMMSIYPIPPSIFDNPSSRDGVRRAMREETRFGVGATFDRYHRREHEVNDDPDWRATRLLAQLQEKGAAQLGTSGSGNHFVDAGVLEVGEAGATALGIEPGSSMAFMSHSGSRGVGASIADHYSKLAQKVTTLPQKMRHLAWLPMSSEEGQEYWLSMNLAGRFASACHHTIHRALAKRMGERPLAQVENHHNFAWREEWNGREVYVHRKGATPAHRGVLGIIPGSQGHPSYIVRGLGSERSLNSASHGAGRVMSRTAARNSIPKRDRDTWLREMGIELLGGGVDEAPQVYKDIRQVLAVQSDLVEQLATFTPKIVLMSDDGRSED